MRKIYFMLIILFAASCSNQQDDVLNDLKGIEQNFSANSAKYYDEFTFVRSKSEIHTGSWIRYISDLKTLVENNIHKLEPSQLNKIIDIAKKLRVKNIKGLVEELEVKLNKVNKSELDKQLIRNKILLIENSILQELYFETEYFNPLIQLNWAQVRVVEHENGTNVIQLYFLDTTLRPTYIIEEPTHQVLTKLTEHGEGILNLYNFESQQKIKGKLGLVWERYGDSIYFPFEL